MEGEVEEDKEKSTFTALAQWEAPACRGVGGPGQLSPAACSSLQALSWFCHWGCWAETQPDGKPTVCRTKCHSTAELLACKAEGK